MLRKLFYAALGAIATVSVVWAAQLPLPSIPGPTLGDPISNLYTLAQAYVFGTGLSTGSALSVSQSSGQTNCTQLNGNSEIYQIGTSSSTGYICLPAALSGRLVRIANLTASTVDIYSSAKITTGTAVDTINTVAGGTAYTGLTTHISTTCFAPKDGAWFCASVG